jgi:hypothetical protein
MLRELKKRIFIIITLLFSLTFILNLSGLAQEPDKYERSENWFRQYFNYNEPFLDLRYDLYSKNDLANFKNKFDLLFKSEPKNEWEGSYYPVSIGGDVSIEQFRWNSNTGYASFYIYTCLPELRGISYGKIVDTPAFVQRLPEYANDSPKKETPSKYVKIKWRQTHYLVEESLLSIFSEKAVGIYVETENPNDENYGKWLYFWEKDGSDEALQGLPEFPKSYSQFKRFPIEAKITAVGKRAIGENEILGNTIYGDGAFYSVTISVGKNRNVKVGMKFYVKDINSEIVITEVNQKSSVGLIHRNIDDNKNDVCYNEEYNPVSCPEIKKSLDVKTYVGKFWY